MSQASDLIAEVKQSVVRVERGIKNFEKDVEEVGHWTDLAQLQIAASRLRMFEETLIARRVDLEEATAPAAEVAPEPATPDVPETHMLAGAVIDPAAPVLPAQTEPQA